MSIIYSDNIKKDLNSYLETKKYTKIFVLVDENTEKYCLNSLGLNIKFQITRISSGENNKNIKAVFHIWDNLLLDNADRDSLLINLGGGVISDIGGFSASTYKRGIDFINIPTTLLAFVDATIGGKNGFNFDNKKNMIGLFSNPKDIFIDIKFLETLEKREFLNGIAEALKHGLLFDMKYFYELIEIILNKGDILDAIKKSINYKKNIIEKDFKEGGIRKILNLGHTIGHGLESYFIKNTIDLKHGEAVVLGLISMLYISKKRFYFDDKILFEVISYFKKIYSLNIYCFFDNKEVINHILNDKKNKNNEILMVLLENFNNPIYDIKVSIEEIEESLNELKRFLLI